jgi:hypothetical protein
LYLYWWTKEVLQLKASSADSRVSRNKIGDIIAICAQLYGRKLFSSIKIDLKDVIYRTSRKY